MIGNINIQKLKDLSKDISILYVEDEESLRNIVKLYLKKFFNEVDVAIDGEDGLNLYKKNKYDLVITDIEMPKLTGIEMASKIKEINEFQNILIISAYSNTAHFTNSIKIGVDGYIIKPIDYNQLNSVLYKISDKINKFKENIEYQNNLLKLVDEKIIGIKKLENDQLNNYKKTLHLLVEMIESRDTYTGGHSLRVAKYSKLIAKKLNLDDKKCEDIYQAGILHDIGKIAIPDNILFKPGKLDNLEYTLIQEHVNLGVNVLRLIPMFEELSNYIVGHHERLDGSGYPNGLKDDKILFESQIMGVADSFDAMTTNRIYNHRKSIKEALNELKSLENIYFKKEIIDAAVEVLSDISIGDNITQEPSTDIEKERFSYFYKDQITQSYNTNYFDLMLIKNKNALEYKFIYLISIHNLSLINNKYGWKYGNEYLTEVFNKLKNIYKNTDIFRVFSDDFAFLTKNKIDIDRKKLEDFICKDGIELKIKIYDIEKEKIFSFYDLESL